MIKNKKLLILGGSRISCEIIRKAKEMGIKTGVSDWYEYDKSPAKQQADYWHNVSTSDIDAMVKLIKEEKYDGLITGFTDSVLPYYAEICEKAGLPCYGTKEQFEILINKNKYKKLCLEYDIPVVSDYRIKEKIIKNDLSGIIYPVLVKPSDSSGARGVTICNSEKELLIGYEKALKFSEAKEVITERFIKGEEITVFWTFIDGNIYLSGVGNRHLGVSEEGLINLPVAYTFPSIHTRDYANRIQPKVERMLKSINIKNGMMFMQCLIEDDEFILYDIGFRLTGSLEYKLLNQICGYDPLEMLITFALTEKMTKEPFNEDVITPVWNRLGCNVSYLIKPGTINKISGLENLKSIPGVIDAVQAHIEGEIIPDSAKGTLKQIAVRAFGVADNETDLKELLNNMYHSVKITSENGENLLLDGFQADQLEGKLLYE